MAGTRYYRGGNSLVPRSIDTVIDALTGLLRTDRGISVLDTPSGLERFGGPYEVTNLPPELHVVKAGRRPGHFEIAPVHPMTPDEYEEALAEIVLVPVTTEEKK